MIGQILQYLTKILTSDTEDQWDKEYDNASLIISDNPRKYQILKYIYMSNLLVTLDTTYIPLKEI